MTKDGGFFSQKNSRLPSCKNNSKSNLDDDTKEEEDDAEARRANGLSERFSILYCVDFVFCCKSKK